MSDIFDILYVLYVIFLLLFVSLIICVFPFSEFILCCHHELMWLHIDIIFKGKTPCTASSRILVSFVTEIDHDHSSEGYSASKHDSLTAIHCSVLVPIMSQWKGWYVGGRAPLILSKHAACQTALLGDLQASVEVTPLPPLCGSGPDSFRSAPAWLT